MSSEETNTPDETQPPAVAATAMLQTRVRETLTPYLPPPVVQGIKQFDAKLAGSVGPEASVTIGSTLVMGWLTLFLLRFLMARIGGSGRAIAGEDEDHVLSGSSLKQADQFDATVLLCGPCQAGKTRLFYQLCHEVDLRTVASIKANVALSRSSSSSEENKNDPVIRYMDWPGHASVDDPILKPVLQSKPRIVLVLDATQPAAAAADVLYQLVAFYTKNNTKLVNVHIVVACHKKDFPKAKNWRRCKIQIRTELERLLSVRRGKTETDIVSDVWWPVEEALDLERMPGGVQLHFVATTCEGGKGCPELETFCRTGEFPVEEAS